LIKNLVFFNDSLNKKIKNTTLAVLIYNPEKQLAVVVINLNILV